MPGVRARNRCGPPARGAAGAGGARGRTSAVGERSADAESARGKDSGSVAGTWRARPAAEAAARLFVADAGFWRGCGVLRSACGADLNEGFARCRADPRTTGTAGGGAVAVPADCECRGGDRQAAGHTGNDARRPGAAGGMALRSRGRFVQRENGDGDLRRLAACTACRQELSAVAGADAGRACASSRVFWRRVERARDRARAAGNGCESVRRDGRAQGRDAVARCTPPRSSRPTIPRCCSPTRA
jgi:hypothetical protein